MQVININNNFIQTCANYIVQNEEKCVIIVPEKICISPLKSALALEIQTGIIPQIISIEGLTEKDSTFASRNLIFAKIFELTSRYITNEQDASTFTRAIIGELPNLHAFKITPRKILEEIPATIATQKEINLNLFAKIWEELNSWLSQNEITPYYHAQELILTKIAQKCQTENTPICIIYDFGRSQTLQNFIKLLKKSEVKATIFTQNYEPLGKVLEENFQILNNVPITIVGNQSAEMQKKIHITSNVSEEYTIANIVREILTQQESSSSAVPQIGIICEDETLSRKISLELEFSNISHQHNIATPIESNSLIKAFLAIFEQKPAKLLPLLKIPNGEKKQILSSIINKEHGNNTLWSEFFSLFPRKSKINKEAIIEVFSFIEKNKNKIHTNKTTTPTFLQFKYFCLNEINNFEGTTIEKSIILHIANSWKIWEAKTPSNIKICNLRSVLFQKFDVIILTSAFKIQPTGNVIFSCGMRLYYGFEMPEIVGNILQTISTHTIITAENSPFSDLQIIKRVLDIQRTSSTRINNNAQLCIEKSQMPRTLSATQIESLFSNPLAFYYQYIKGLREVQYTSKIAMEIGNFTHLILEFATNSIIKNSQFNFVQYVKDSFSKASGGKFKSVEVFYIKPILDALEDIRTSQTRSISVEPQGMQVQLSIQNEIFTITAKPDRIDTITDSIIIYDYKSGSSSSFTKSSIKNLEKIQPIIPAMFLMESTGNLKQFFGNYTFLEHSVRKNITFEITPELIEQFKEKLSKAIELYCDSGEVLPIGKDMRSFYHTGRNF